MTSIANLLLGSPCVTVEAESTGSEASVGSGEVETSPYVNLTHEEVGAEAEDKGVKIHVNDAPEFNISSVALIHFIFLFQKISTVSK